MIDFVHNILFGIDYPGLVKALDPITLGLLVGQGIQQFGKIREAKQQEEAAQTQMTQGQNLYDKMVSEFESGKYDVSLSQDVRDTAEQQRILAEQVTDAATERAVQAQQSALAAARYGDARSAALIPSQVRQLEAGVQQAEIQGLQQKVASDAALASAQQRIDEQNKQLQQSLGAMKLKRGAAGIDAGQLAAQQARAAGAAAKSALFATIGQGLTAGLAGRSGDGGDNNSTSEVNSLLRRLETNPSNTLDATLRAQLSDPLFENEEEDIPLDFNIGDVFQQRARPQGVDTFQGSGKKGMQYEFADKGGEVHMTEGSLATRQTKRL